MRLTMIAADNENEKNCSLYNIIYPAKEINKLDGHTAEVFHIEEFKQNTEAVQKSCSESDLIIIERNLFGDVLTMIQFWKVRNKNICAILDDGYQVILPQNAAYSFWGLSQVLGKNNETGEQVMLNIVPPPLKQLGWGLRMVKSLLVPSKQLSIDWAQHTKTYRIHNYLDGQRYEGIDRLFPHEDTIFLYWGGSLSHFESFEGSGLFTALSDTLKRFKNVRLLISGDKRVYDRVIADEGKKFFSPFVKEEDWGKLLRSADIGLCPLSGVYDLRRSYLKPLEFFASGVPVLGSNLSTYEELFEYGTFIDNGIENWKRALAKMIRNYPEYKAKAEKAKEFALTQTYERNIQKLLDVYQQVINDEYI